MNPKYSVPPGSLARSFFLLLCLCALVLVPGPRARAADTGTITGNVSNRATGNLLEGARIEVKGLGLATLTDETGRFVLSGVPTGEQELVVSYIGLDAVRAKVAVGSAARVVQDFELTTAIYKLDSFKVNGEREGGAAAITAQRNAPNLKNVVSMDSFGQLPNMSAGEVLMRLPGVAGSPTDEGLAYNFNIRGISPGLNSVTVDGGQIPSIGTSRAFEMQSITGAMFEELELIKGQTPDRGADSLGGTVNLKTRSTLSMRDRRRFTYSTSVRAAAPFTQQVPMREDHRYHPLLNFGYQEVFDVFGGERNLGFSVNLFYSENAVGTFQTDRDFQNTTTQPAYVWNYQTSDNFNDRKQASVNMKTDYRLSPNTKLSLNTIVNDNNERFRRRFQTRAYTGSQNQNQVPNATTSSIVPGFTNRITEVRPVATSTIDAISTGPGNYFVRLRVVDFGVEQEFGPLKLDYNARYTRNDLNLGHTPAGNFTNRITGVGWILDRTQSDLYPKFTQTAGPDITDPANWRPAASNALTSANSQQDQIIREVRGNALYALPFTIPLSLKTGVQWRETHVVQSSGDRRWNYVGTGPLAASTNVNTFDKVKTGRQIPYVWASTIISEGKLADPAAWSEDRYFFEQLKYTGAKDALETVEAVYAMAQGKLGRQGLLGHTGFLGGVRWEKTETDGVGYVRARVASTAAQQVADPVGSAQRDYAGTKREIKGNYTKAFPSVHLTHDITPNLKARLAWSTSFGRAGIGEFLPNESANETAQTITVNNPALLPQTATNWDATLDYYFEPVGNLSVGWFHKTIRDYIVRNINSGIIGTGNDNGYNGEYAGFTRFTSANAGTAFVQGMEFSYQQQFTFLPGFLKGLSGSANYSFVDTHGNFGGATYRTTNQITGFIPRSGNLMLSWRYRAFSTRLLANYTSDYITEYSATDAGRNLYRQKLTTVNLGLAYQVRPGMSVTCDISNLFNAPQVLYRGIRDQMARTIINGTTFNLGLSGQF